jgi:hypothetical protein
MLADEEIRDMCSLCADRNVELNLFVTPRASFDTGGLWSAPAGKAIGWQNRGAEQLRFCLDDIFRALDLGVRSVLLADIGLIQCVDELRRQMKLPADLVIKSSALMATANPASARVLERIGANSVNVATDLSVPQLSAIRQAIKIAIDMYLEAPDGLGGFIRHHEAPGMVRYACPIYLKLGLRNSPDVYPSGYHLESTLVALSRERVRRAWLVHNLIRREYPEAVGSRPDAPNSGVPVI